MEILTNVKLNRTTILRALNINATSSRSAVDLAHNIYGKSHSKGGKPPVVVLHGLLSSKKLWAKVCQRIADNTQRTVIAADLRNHGESPYVATHTYPELASDVLQLLSKLSISKAVLLGHSMGGRTSMVLALTEPAMVSQLIAIDISPVSSPKDIYNFAKILEIMDTLNVSFEEYDDVDKARAAAKEKVKASGIVEDVDTLNFVFKKIDLRPGNKIGWMVNVPVLKQHFQIISSFPKEMNRKIYPGPTLFIGGENSDFIPPSDLPGIMRFFPAVQLEYVEGAGHRVTAGNPVTFHRLLTSFLS